MLKGRRLKGSTATGSYICKYGRNSGPVYGPTCGEVTSKNFNPNYTAPNSPYACSNGPSYVYCQNSFVEVQSRTSEKMYCRGGDSGAPIFAYDIAFGILSGCANYSGSDETYNYIYTSMDEAYTLGFSLVYGP